MTAPLWTQVYYQIVSDCPFVDTGLLSDTDSDCPFVDTGLLSDSDCRGLLSHTGRQQLQRSTITHRQMVTAEVYYHTQADGDCKGLLSHTGRLTAEVCYHTQADGDCRGLLSHTGRRTAHQAVSEHRHPQSDTPFLLLRTSAGGLANSVQTDSWDSLALTVCHHHN